MSVKNQKEWSKKYYDNLMAKGYKSYTIRDLPETIQKVKKYYHMIKGLGEFDKKKLKK